MPKLTVEQELRVAQLLHTQASIKAQFANAAKRRADAALAIAVNNLQIAKEAMKGTVKIGVR